MHPLVRLLLPFLLGCAILPVRGEEPPAAQAPAPPRHEYHHGAHLRDMTPEERAAWREERRARREQWRQMSPEERHQLRRDIREAGRDLYFQRHHGRD